MYQAILIIGVIITVSLLGLAGGVLLLWKEKVAKKITLYLVSFAAGALLGITFFDLIPEAIEHNGDAGKILLTVFFGFLAFYVIEKAISCFHCHHDDCQIATPRYLIVIGDFAHNLIDGILIAVTFMIDARLGFVVAAGVLLHELPQEIGDFGVLLHTGLSRVKAIWYNLLSAGGALLGGVLVLIFGHSVEALSPWLLAVVAGNFLYLAAVVLLPSAHHHGKTSRRRELTHVAFFILGTVFMWGISAGLPHEHVHAHEHEPIVIERHFELNGHHHDVHPHEHDY